MSMDANVLAVPAEALNRQPPEDRQKAEESQTAQAEEPRVEAQEE
jgi:hypothetical protein